ncbi:MAG: hypothetical protein A3E87_02510 [Gammaproteobacteria bacterium RIFCSPHIGHO2_12_FULL_35_23]|nr:MAG: hypothetical protein A3E87_02510 [Gammaproteobacteria bacterium RIFCSPHIGHO2_12_FULL_35_23]
MEGVTVLETVNEDFCNPDDLWMIDRINKARKKLFGFFLAMNAKRQLYDNPEDPNYVKYLLQRRQYVYAKILAQHHYLALYEELFKTEVSVISVSQFSLRKQINNAIEKLRTRNSDTLLAINIDELIALSREELTALYARYQEAGIKILLLSEQYFADDERLAVLKSFFPGAPLITTAKVVSMAEIVDTIQIVSKQFGQPIVKAALLTSNSEELFIAERVYKITKLSETGEILVKEKIPDFEVVKVITELKSKLKLIEEILPQQIRELKLAFKTVKESFPSYTDQESFLSAINECLEPLIKKCINLKEYLLPSLYEDFTNKYLLDLAGEIISKTIQGCFIHHRYEYIDQAAQRLGLLLNTVLTDEVKLGLGNYYFQFLKPVLLQFGFSGNNINEFGQAILKYVISFYKNLFRNDKANYRSNMINALFDLFQQLIIPLCNDPIALSSASLLGLQSYLYEQLSISIDDEVITFTEDSADFQIRKLVNDLIPSLVTRGSSLPVGQTSTVKLLFIDCDGTLMLGAKENCCRPNLASYDEWACFLNSLKAKGIVPILISRRIKGGGEVDGIQDILNHPELQACFAGKVLLSPLVPKAYAMQRIYEELIARSVRGLNYEMVLLDDEPEEANYIVRTKQETGVSMQAIRVFAEEAKDSEDSFWIKRGLYIANVKYLVTLCSPLNVEALLKQIISIISLNKLFAVTVLEGEKDKFLSQRIFDLMNVVVQNILRRNTTYQEEMLTALNFLLAQGERYLLSEHRFLLHEIYVANWQALKVTAAEAVQPQIASHIKEVTSLLIGPISVASSSMHSSVSLSSGAESDEDISTEAEAGIGAGAGVDGPACLFKSAKNSATLASPSDKPPITVFFERRPSVHAEEASKPAIAHQAATV